MRYELYNFNLEITKAENKQLYDAVKTEDWEEANKLIDDFVRTVDGYRIFDNTPIIYTDYQKALDNMGQTFYRFSNCGSTFVVVDGSVLVHYDEIAEEDIDYTYSKCI